MIIERVSVFLSWTLKSELKFRDSLIFKKLL